QVIATKGFGGNGCSRFEHIDRRQVKAFHCQNEVPRVIAKFVEVHPGIAPRDELYPLFYQAPYHGKALSLPLPEFCSPGQVRVLHQQFATPLKDRGAHVNASIDNALPVFWLILCPARPEERAVFNGGDTRGDRREHSWCTVRMRRDAFVEAACLLGEGTHFSLRILCGEAIGARRGATTGGKHFDKIGASFHLGAYGASDLHIAISFNPAKPQMPSRGGDPLPRGNNTRAHHCATLHRRPYRKGNAVQRATITHCGYASAQRRLDICHCPDELGFIRLPLMVVKDRVARAEGHMRMHIDQPRQDRCSRAKIEHLRQTLCTACQLCLDRKSVV